MTDSNIESRGPAAEPAAVWRSLDQLNGSPASETLARQEFPGFQNVFESLGEAELKESPVDAALTLNRRQFVALSTTAVGLAGLSGCRRPELPILPYSATPDYVIPGAPLYYATSMPRSAGCAALLIESHEGRPTKVEGNPKHPGSFGASDLHAQASIFDLYSPDRSTEVLHQGTSRSWEEFDLFAASHFGKLAKKQGEGLRLLFDSTPSLSMAIVREHVNSKFPNARWHQYTPVDRSNSRLGTALAFQHLTKKKIKDDNGADIEKELPTALDVHYDFKQALRIVSLDCDFLGVESTQAAHSRAAAELRRPPEMRDLFAGRAAEARWDGDKHRDLGLITSRLYVLENTYSVTGAMADHRLRIPATHILDYAVLLAKEIVSTAGFKTFAGLATALDRAPLPGVVIPERWIKEVAADLLAFNGKSLLLAGQRQPPLVHALCALVNELLGNAGKTVSYTAAAEEATESIAELVKAMQAGKVDSLVIVGGNPAWNAPVDLDFAAALEKVPTVIRLGEFLDETSEKAAWHLPRAHYLETWGDVESSDGIYSIVQPLISPLHGGRSDLELLIQLSGYDGATGYADARSKVYPLLQKAFTKRSGKEDELAFKRFIQEGFEMAGGTPPVKPAINEKSLLEATRKYQPVATVSEKNMEVSFHLDYRLFDGRFAWNAWLLELPDPITKLSWDNAALISPRTALAMRVETGDVMEITISGRSIRIPAFILPGQADHSISVTLGHGKLRFSRADQGGGFDVYPIRSTSALHFAPATVKRTSEKYDLVTTQEHGTIPRDKQHDIIRDYAVEEYERAALLNVHDGSPTAVEHDKNDPKSRFQWGYRQSAYADAGPGMKDIKRIALQTAQDVSIPQRLDGSSQWGMVIDLNSCTGCSACVVACQVENNIPVVGKREVKMNREMHWISLHRYFMQSKGPVHAGLEQAPADDPSMVIQPMMCQQCEGAPCESVCPVNAAVHSPEGLNLQVYNRCIGTRYCSNNCPYKARRFNWFDFNKRRIDQLRVPTPFSEAGTPETLKMQKNPEVTVRMRGVMEKCTYCVQRIERGKIGAKVLANKAGEGRVDTPVTSDTQQEYRQGYAIREIDGVSKVIVPDGIIKTACEQACPSGAIVFGNVRDEKSRAYRLKNLGPDYLVLGELNAKPRTSYMPRLRNLNPKMTTREAGA